MNSRIPTFILAALVVVAIIWRLTNPPPPALPGPYGMPPTWDSQTKVGVMAASAVSPSGTMWAGAWNQKTKDGKLKSALVVIDLEKSKAYRQDLGLGTVTSGLGWAEDGTVAALIVDSEDPADATSSRIGLWHNPGAGNAKYSATEPLKETVARVLSWLPGTDKFCAQLGGQAGIRVAAMEQTGTIIGKPVSVAPPNDTKFYRAAGMAADGGSFVFSEAEDTVGGNVTYYIVDAVAGTAKKAFTSKDIPGRVEGMWVSPAGVLVVMSQRDKLDVLRYDPATGKIAPAIGAEIAKSWPTAPKSMMFVTYNAGYDLDLATGKAKKLFDLTRQGQYSDAWRRHVQDGRLYPRKDGDYTAISVLADAVDIRIIKKDGDRGKSILPRG